MIRARAEEGETSQRAVRSSARGGARGGRPRAIEFERTIAARRVEGHAPATRGARRRNRRRSRRGPRSRPSASCPTSWESRARSRGENARCGGERAVARGASLAERAEARPPPLRSTAVTDRPLRCEHDSHASTRNERLHSLSRASRLAPRRRQRGGRALARRRGAASRRRPPRARGRTTRRAARPRRPPPNARRDVIIVDIIFNARRRRWSPETRRRPAPPNSPAASASSNANDGDLNVAPPFALPSPLFANGVG